MTSRFLGVAYLTLSVIVLLFLAQVSQKPHCINSQVIEKITMTDKDIVYRCVVNRKVPYSPSFVQNQNLIEDKILSFERWLGYNWPGKVPRIAIQIEPAAHVTSRVGKTISIWEQNLKSTSQLEIEIAKNFLLQRNPAFFENNDLAFDAAAEFIVRIWNDNKKNTFGGLSTYLAYQWWKSYSQLPSVQKNNFLKKLPDIFKNAEPKNFKDAETSSFDKMIQAMEVFKSEKNFYALLEKQSEFEDGFFTASFDYLVLMEEPRAGLFKNRSDKLNFGIWDGKSLYHLGSRSQVAASSFKKLKVRNLIWESCDDLDLNSVLSVKADVKKLLVIKNCSKQNQPDYSQYANRGIAGFAAMHPQLSFVQLDMPSLNMRKDQIVLQQKIFDLMAKQAMNKDEKNPFFVTFGLQELKWNQELQIFTPKSHIDAVESFRIFKPN